MALHIPYLSLWVLALALSGCGAYAFHGEPDSRIRVWLLIGPFRTALRVATAVMTRMAVIVLISGVCMPETLRAGVVLEAGEVDSSKVIVGAFAEVVYGRGKRDPVSGAWEKLARIKGHVKAVDAESLTIGQRFWKKQIAFECIQKLIIAESGSEWDRLREATDPRFARTVEIDSSKVIVGAFVEIIYGKGKRDPVSGKWEKLAGIKGHVKAVDAESLTIGQRFWKKQIAFECIQKLIIAESGSEWDKLRETTDPRFTRTGDREGLGLGLMFEGGYFWGVRTTFLDLYSHGYKYDKGLPWSSWSVSLHLGHFLSGGSRWRLALRGAYRTVQVFPKSPEAEYTQRSPFTLEENFIRERNRYRAGFTYRLISMLLACQRVVHSSERVIVLADLAGGLSFKDRYFNSGGDRVDSRQSLLPWSAGVAFLLPVRPRFGLQATVRADLLRAYYPDPFTSGMSVAFGPLLEF